MMSSCALSEHVHVPWCVPRAHDDITVIAAITISMMSSCALSEHVHVPWCVPRAHDDINVIAAIAMMSSCALVVHVHVPWCIPGVWNSLGRQGQSWKMRWLLSGLMWYKQGLPAPTTVRRLPQHYKLVESNKISGQGREGLPDKLWFSQKVPGYSLHSD